MMRKSQRNSSNDELKVAIVGDVGVGKSSLVSMMVDGLVRTSASTPQSPVQVKVVKTDGLVVKLHVWDTDAAKPYDPKRVQAYSGCSVVVICLAIDLSQLLTRGLNRWLSEARQYCPRAPVMLVGCKSDTRSNNDAPLCKATATQIAKKCKSNYIECSALQNNGVRDVMQTVACMKTKTKKRKHSGCVIC